jgi:hypothetical protein
MLMAESGSLPILTDPGGLELTKHWLVINCLLNIDLSSSLKVSAMAAQLGENNYKEIIMNVDVETRDNLMEYVRL